MLKRLLKLIFFVFISKASICQVDPNTLMGVPILTTAERTGIVAPITEGNMVYDSDINRLFEYTDTGWQEILTAGSTAYVGAFEITGAGTVTITGIPFRPASLSFVAHANVETFNNINSDNGTFNNDTTISNSFGSMNGIARDTGAAPFFQRCIYVGGSGNSINDISRYSSNVNCIGVRYGNQNGNIVGLITGAVTAFTANGFTLAITYANGVPATEGLAVLFTAYR